MQSLRCELKPSRVLRLIFISLWTLSALAILLAVLPWYQQAVLFLLLTAYAVFLLKKYNGLDAEAMPLYFDIHHRDKVYLCLQSQEQLQVSLCGHSVLTPYFAFLTFRDHHSSKARSYMIFPDHLPEGVFRRMYLRFKWNV